MAPRDIDRLRAKVRDGLLLIPFHAANELDDDEISVLDVEQVILTGDITQRQRDSHTGERKYVIRGGTLTEETACCVVKIGPTGQVILITAWVE